jgi:hypothetical protein
MPQLSFPISANEARVDVRINLDSATLQALAAAGLSVPASIEAPGLLDTGSDISGVASTILQQLAVPVFGRGTTLGIGGSVSVRLFKVTFLILDASQPHLPWLVRPDVMVMELPPGAPVDVVLGMDVLLTCRMLLDGPALQVILEF